MLMDGRTEGASVSCTSTFSEEGKLTPFTSLPETQGEMSAPYQIHGALCLHDLSLIPTHRAMYLHTLSLIPTHRVSTYSLFNTNTEAFVYLEPCSLTLSLEWEG